jgi:TetR/AcrR family transcriptional regulator, tetracycline repressor protein
MLVALARTLEDEPDVERYYAFGIDLLMAGVETIVARSAPAGPAAGRPAGRSRRTPSASC